MVWTFLGSWLPRVHGNAKTMTIMASWTVSDCPLPAQVHGMELRNTAKLELIAMVAGVLREFLVLIFHPGFDFDELNFKEFKALQVLPTVEHVKQQPEGLLPVYLTTCGLPCWRPRRTVASGAIMRTLMRPVASGH